MTTLTAQYTPGFPLNGTPNGEQGYLSVLSQLGHPSSVVPLTPISMVHVLGLAWPMHTTCGQRAIAEAKIPDGVAT